MPKKLSTVESQALDQSESDVWYKPELYRDMQSGVKSKLIFIVGLCSFFILIELFGAILSNSIAIFTDVVHLLSDLLGFVFSLISVYLAS